MMPNTEEILSLLDYILPLVQLKVFSEDTPGDVPSL